MKDMEKRPTLKVKELQVLEVDAADGTKRLLIPHSRWESMECYVDQKTGEKIIISFGGGFRVFAASGFFDGQRDVYVVAGSPDLLHQLGLIQ